MSKLGTKTISSVPVVPFALMFGVISAVIGLVMGIIFAVFFGAFTSVPIPTDAIENQVVVLGWFRTLFSIGALIIMPILGFAGGFIQGAIYAVLYNFLAPKIGGIQLCFKEEQ